jgi:hypothetical protein
MKSHSPLIRQSSIFALAKTHKASALYLWALNSTQGLNGCVLNDFGNS